MMYDGVKRDNLTLQLSKVIILVRGPLKPMKEEELIARDQRFGKDAKALQMDESFVG